MTSYTTPQLRAARDAGLAGDLDGMSDCDAGTLAVQIGDRNILAISGGRVLAYRSGIYLPVSSGYAVTVDLAPGDTYTVRRVRHRAGVTAVIGEVSGVYCDQVGEQAYQASCFRNVAFGEHAGSFA